MSEKVLVHAESVGEIRTVTLDSPHNRNALSVGLVSQLLQHLRDAEADEGVRAVVLTHTGSTFCAGADLGVAAGDDMSAAMRSSGQQLLELLRTMVTLGKPILGVIDGHVRAGGMGLVGACDIACASTNASFGLSEARLGLAAAIISVTVLPRLSSRTASRYFLTGEVFSAAQAVDAGLLSLTDGPSADFAASGKTTQEAAQTSPGSTAAASESAVVSTGDGSLIVGRARVFWPKTHEVLQSLLLGSPQGLRESKRLVNVDLLQRIDSQGDALVERSLGLFASAEARAGMQAFLRREQPWWVR